MENNASTEEQPQDNSQTGQENTQTGQENYQTGQERLDCLLCDFK